MKFLPIREIVPWPEDLFSLPDDHGSNPLDNIGIEDYRFNGSLIELDMLCANEAVIGFPEIDSFSIVIGGSDYTRFGAAVSFSDPFEIAVSTSISFRFSSSLFKPVRRSENGKYFEIIRDEETGEVRPYQIDLGNITLKVNSNAEITIETGNNAPSFSLPPVMIGESGVIIEASNIAFIFSQDAVDSISGLPPSSRGIYIDDATIHLPKDISVVLPSDIQLDDFLIGSGGLSGKATGNWTPQLSDDGSAFTGNGAGEVFGIPFGMKSISLEFKQNTFVDSSIQGTMILPFFDGPVDVNINLTNDGNFAVSLLSTTGNGLVTLTKQDLLELQLKNIAFEKREDVLLIEIGGTITPLFGGFGWPSFEVESLTIDSRGRVRIAGGWLNLREKKTFDLYGVALEVSAVGFGTEDDGTRWIGFSGGLKLCEGLPMSGAVEGLRVNWKGSDVWLEFSGAEVAFEIPDAIEFTGRVAFIEDPKEPKHPSLPKTRGFKGGGKLKVIPTGLGIDAQLVIGKNDANPSYTFFYIFVDTQLPAGIPLGNSGVAFYGFGGLFGYNMVPKKGVDQPWF